MRLFAEEKKLGTIELLLTNPIRDIEIMAGKYLACFLVFCVMLLFTFLYPIVFKIIFALEIKPLIAGYTGLLLLGASFIACGLFVSSLTENQVVAAIATMGLLVFLWFIDWNEGVAGSGTMVLIIHQLSLSEHFFNFIKGVIEIDDIIYYLSFISFFLFMTKSSLESRKWRGKQ
jgi:ABC-2 type transport system permease protein